MAYLLRFLLCLIQFAVGCVFLWLIFWVINGVMWLSGVGVEALLTDHFLAQSGSFLRAVIYLIGFEWLYGLAMFYMLIQLSKTSDDGDFFDGWSIGTGIALCVFIIMVYDPRIAAHLPALFASPVEFLQTSCAAHLVGGISMTNVDFSGNITDPVYYTLFDLLIGAAGAFWLFAKLVLDRD